MDGDFQGEVRTDDNGVFTLYPVPGQWRLITWAPGVGRGDAQLELKAEPN